MIPDICTIHDVDQWCLDLCERLERLEVERSRDSNSLLSDATVGGLGACRCICCRSWWSASLKETAGRGRASEALRPMSRCARSWLLEGLPHSCPVSGTSSSSLLERLVLLIAALLLWLSLEPTGPMHRTTGVALAAVARELSGFVG